MKNLNMLFFFIFFLKLKAADNNPGMNPAAFAAAQAKIGAFLAHNSWVQATQAGEPAQNLQKKTNHIVQRQLPKRLRKLRAKQKKND